MVSTWRERQKQELRQQLFKTALQLFEANGYERTTVQQITERVGVAKGTFFNHFPTKEHVVEEWYNEITFTSLASARERDQASAEESICSLFADMTRQATDAPELLIAKSRNSSNPLLMKAEHIQVTEVNAYLREQCIAGKERGELAADLDEQFFVGLLGAVLTGSARAWVWTQPRFDFPTVICERIRFLFRAAKPAGI